MFTPKLMELLFAGSVGIRRKEMKKIRFSNPLEILMDKKHCPYCKKNIMIHVIQNVQDGEFPDNLNSEVNLKKIK